MLILFDIDGTLVDHDTAQDAAAKALFDYLDLPGEAEAFAVEWVAALERHFPRYLAGEISYTEQRRARLRDVVDPNLADRDADRFFETYVRAYEDAWALFPDSVPCLDRLSGCRLGIISNGEATQQRAKLERTGILDRFTHVVISDDCGHAKPSPRIFHHACVLFGEHPGTTLYVGDRYDVDALAARRAGLRGIWLDRHGVRIPDHSSPIIRTLAELEGSEEPTR